MFTQENRLISVGTPLGEDELILAGFTGDEDLSSLFSFELELFSENNSIDFQEIIGRNITISITLSDEEKRYFNGIVSRFSQGTGKQEAELSSYTATMVPWLWLLTKTADSRIFQELSVPDIVEQIFGEHGFSDFSFRLLGSYPPLEYAVQYRETDFNFISRLFEAEGIYYFFEHEDRKHTMVITDSPVEHHPCPNQESVRCQLTGGGNDEGDAILSLAVMKEIRAGKYTLNDFNFKSPNTDLNVSADSRVTLGPGEREIYDYPGEFTLRRHGDHIVNIRMEEEEARITTMTGMSSCRSFATGFRFELQDYYREDMNEKEYTLTHIEHEANLTETFSSSASTGSQSELSYSNHFTCIPYEDPFRPVRSTPKPIIEGVQTAIVVGPSGEEIYTDEHGRVKVQFHWDREGQNDENSSCWIRVSQVWAGAGWGAMYIPRIGQEVIVEFEEGDPDRPIITGRVYHGSNRPPYGLPAEKTKSTIKSDSTLGGGGSNEFRFEDKKGSEEIFLHGQKDWTIAIENDKNQTIGRDETMSVGNNRTKGVGVDQKETIGSNKTIQVGANHSETIGANMTLDVGKNKTETVAVNTVETIGSDYQVTVGAAMTETIGAARIEEVGAAKAVTIGSDYGETIGANKSVKVAKSISESAAKDIAIQSGKKISLSAGDDIIISGNKKGVIEIKDELIIKIGKASISFKKSGDITIKGKKINLKGSGNIKLKGKKILGN
ncbi:MAG: type VI secretion system tip protein VgrG [Desulfobacula sp.]|uniref:type VI secretion system Vgr family protein n=1 Tax=Desulfobacula sp. TaxID=2593537 RepID=UPI0025C6E4B4|nr:type VI secretion system tip protein TssI/VgrG [Desulfobacula sp.]MCD4721618.1 type VI secretion system tip protein VgrG [Desulfobacula sp.]